jgi:hypothetical protein
VFWDLVILQGTFVRPLREWHASYSICIIHPPNRMFSKLVPAYHILGQDSSQVSFELTLKPV